jgi:hypothetical protein
MRRIPMLLTIANKTDDILATIVVEVLPRVGEKIAFQTAKATVSTEVLEISHHYFHWQSDEAVRHAKGIGPSQSLNHRYYAIVDVDE